MEFFNAFGINGKIVLAQVINFAILAFILTKIGYKPLKKFVEERTAQIEAGLKNADQATLALQEAQVQQDQMLSAARKEAAQLIESAHAKAKEQGDAQIAKAKNEVAAVVSQGKQVIAAERQKMMDEVKADIISMVVASTRQVLSGAVSETVDEAWMKKQLAKVKK